MNEGRKNSVTQLSELYNVVIGIALSIAVYNTIDHEAVPVPLHLEYVTNFATILVLIVPFYHGAVRHLFATYVEDGGSTRITNGALLLDFFLLFMEGCLFVMIASLIENTLFMAWLIVSLLILDSVWGFLAKLAFTGAKAQNAEQIWSAINFVTAILLILILIFASHVFEATAIAAQLGLLALVALRTVVDYWFCWTFYFPDPTPKST